MNKQFYRIKFNAKLGTYIAVSELAKSHQGNTSPRIKSSINHSNDLTESNIATTGQRTLKQLVLALCSWMAISPIYANVVVNKSAIAAQQATVLKEGNAANVWITTPSTSGVSRNSYTQFDVNKNGVILNNSRGATTSKITKTSIAANPNLAKGAATTIVNEVTSSNPSLLQGNLEVLGSKANVVVANPTGITVNGGGFINANQVTLSTGVLGYNSDGSIKQHTVKQGAITINPNTDNLGLGGNSNNPVALELLGRSIAINAPVNATTITAITGANKITTDTGKSAVTGTGTVPTVAIDIAQLGGLYANSIYLYANDKGVGVNNAGVIKAKNNVVLNSNGKITNAVTGLIQTTDATNGLMSIQTNQTNAQGDIVNTGNIKSANALFVDAGRNLYLKQDSYTGVTNTASKNIMSLDAKGSVVGTGAVVKQYGRGQDVYINAGSDISLTGKQGSGIQNNVGSNGDVYLNAGKKVKVTNGLITGIGGLAISSTNQLDLKDSNLYSRDAGIYINSVETDIANAAINVTNTVLDAKTKLAIQSSGLLNLTNLSLPIASGKTSTRVQDVVFTAQQNLNLNQNQQMLQPITGKLDIAAGGDVSLVTGLTDANIEVKGLGGVNIEGVNVKTKNIKLSTVGNLNVNAQNDINLQDNTSLWASSGDINVSALEGNLTTTGLNALATKGKVSLLADKDVRLKFLQKNDVVEGTTALDQTNQKSKITAGQDINIGSMNQGSLYLNAADIKSTAGNINLIADKDIKLYRTSNIKQVKNTDGSFTPKTTYLWSDFKAKDITVKSANGSAELQWLKANATNDLIIDAKGMNRIYGGELKSGRNIELHGGDHVRLWKINSNSGAHTAVSSDKNIYLNSTIDAKGQTNWAATSTVNMTASGLLSLKSKGLQAHQRTNLKGGAINIEAGKSFEWKDKYTLNAIDSAILKNNKDLVQFNGDIGIQTGSGNISISPTNITLNAYGDIDLRAKGGDLTLVGIRGANGNGSEQLVKLNSSTGSINLEAKKVELEASQLTANKDVSILSTNGDLIVGGIKNNLINKSKVDKNAELENTQKKVLEELDLLKGQQFISDYNNMVALDENWSKGGYHLDILAAFNQAYETFINKYPVKPNPKLLIFGSTQPLFHNILYEHKPSTRFDASYVFLPKYDQEYLDTLQSDINFYKTNINGYEHVGSKLLSGNGNISLISSKGISVTGSSILASNGIVDVEARKSLTKSYTSNTVKKDEQPRILNASIIMDGTVDFYDKGLETDSNYSMRTVLNPTILNGKQGINIRTIGNTDKDNLILQAVGVVSQQGDVKIESNKNILFDAAIEQNYDRSTKTEKKKSWGGLKKKYITTKKENESTNTSSVDIQAKNIFIESKEKNPSNSIDIYSGNFQADDGLVSIKSGGNLNFYTTEEISTSNTDITKKSSFAGIKYNTDKSTSSRNLISEIPAVLQADYIGTKSGFDTRLEGTEFNYLRFAQIEAGGTLSLLVAKKSISELAKSESNSIVWQKMQDKGSITETAKLPSFNGPVAPTFTAKGGLNVQIPISEKDQNKVIIRDEILKIANQPGNSYLKELINRKDIDWSTLILAQKDWNYKSQGLTGAGAAIIVIIVAVLTYGAGTALAGTAATASTSGTAIGITTTATAAGSTTTLGGITLATTVGTGASAVTTYTAAGTMLNTALTSIATQSSISLINNGGDISQTLKELGSKNSVKNLATAVVTAGLLSSVSQTLNIKIDDMPQFQQFANNFVKGVGGNIISSTLNGGSLSDNLDSIILSGFSSALHAELATSIGENFSPLLKENPDIFDKVLHKIIHVAAGCAVGSIQKQCEASAIGAGVGEVLAEAMLKNNIDNQTSIDETKIKNYGKIISGIISAYGGYDVNIAATSSETVIENNALASARAKVEQARRYCSAAGFSYGSNGCKSILTKKYEMQPALRSALVRNNITEFVMETIEDLTPIWGDIKAFRDASTGTDYLLASVGILPIGDLIKSGKKTITLILNDGTEVEAAISTAGTGYKIYVPQAGKDLAEQMAQGKKVISTTYRPNARQTINNIQGVDKAGNNWSVELIGSGSKSNKAVKVTYIDITPTGVKTTKVANIAYDQRGLPIFDNVAKFTTQITDHKSESTQFKYATLSLWDAIQKGQVNSSQFTTQQLNQIKAGNSKIMGYTWHHNAQSSPNNMQLISESVHNAVKHVGQDSLKQGVGIN